MRARLFRRLANRGATEVIPASVALESSGADELVEAQAVVPAAVLVPLVERPEGMTVLLTRRADHLNDHPGQISFPGGRIEARDDDDIDAALRETEEEIGLERAHVEVIGCLDTCLTGTGFRVVPVVGLVSPPFTLALDSSEVAEAFEVPLSFVLDARNHQRRSAVRPGGDRREFYVLPWPDNHIWGATARILVNLHDLLAD
ncbi:MAG: CoA pyrophosphatase [Alphaproteobacteria bacterium]|mgnify:CR=1 FL=1|jgi:8-oxo-dGTP pyrophosphatase MutT (NUDIX family)|nr:CoA pyrophosphatase [Alphaproteobacteria bacterium]MDP6518034.1 CoA pyrophosphatase [Alphaproteobacteria bacterium]